MDEDEDEVDLTTRRMHTTPRSRIAMLVTELRGEGWQIALEEWKQGQMVVFAHDVSATEEWPDFKGGRPVYR